MRKIYEIGARIRANRAELRRGTVLDPDNHPSYSDAKVAAIKTARARRDKTIKSAQTRFENEVNAA